MTIPGARTRSRILGVDGPHRGMFCLAWDWTVALSIRLVTSGDFLQPHPAQIRVASLSPLADCGWGVVGMRLDG